MSPCSSTWPPLCTTATGSTSSRSRRRRRRRRRPAPLRLARHGAGDRPPVPGRQVRHRPDHRERLLLRPATAGAHQRGRPGARREGDGEDREPEPAGGAVRAAGGRGAGRVRGRRARRRRVGPAHRARPAVQGGADRGPRHRRRGHRRGGPDDQRLPSGRVRGSLPRAAPAEHQQARQRNLQAHQPRRRLLARRREEPDAHPRVRDRLPEQGGAGGVPRGARAGPPARPPAHRPGPRPLQLPRGGPRLPVLPPQRHAPLERHGRLLARRARARRLRGDQHARHPAPRALGAQRPLGQLQGEHVLHRDRRDSRTR